MKAFRDRHLFAPALLAAGLLIGTLVAPAVAVGAATKGLPKPFGRLLCAPSDGVRLCRGGFVGTEDLRVPSFDGVPLDTDLTLPAAGKAPYPLIVLLQGIGGNKFDYESTSDDGMVDNVTLASQGWAVLTYTARGFGNSCGTAASRVHTPACAKGWEQLADSRYEVHDTQYLAGVLVDEGYARPGIAVAGVSYGGGQSLELAMLKNRIRLTDGRYVPFVSPKRHIPMSVVAAFAMWPWDDLATALDPNGRLSTSTDTPAVADRQPAGVAKEQWDSVLYATAAAGYLSPPGVDPTSDLTDWEHATVAGEPFSSSESGALADLQAYKSAIGIPMPRGGPAPTVIQSGWTDSLFPVNEALHFANRVRASGAKTPLLLIFDDVGHPWAQNKTADVAFNQHTGIAFLDAVALQHRRPETGIDVRAQTCPATAPSGPTVHAASYGALQDRTLFLQLTGSGRQQVTSTGGSPTVANSLDAVDQPLCDPLPAAVEPGTATYTVPAGSTGLHVLGGVTIKADLSVVGLYPELVARLWDVSPNGTTRQIVEMGAFRPSVNQSATTQSGTTATESISFQLPPNDYVVPAGDTLQLELVGSTAPFFRASNGTFSITVTNLRATVPLA
jgi:hypothetical protein